MRADPYHVDVRKTLATSAIACMASGLVGQTGFGSQQVITFAANYARSVYATDLDGDGDADVLSASTADDKIACYFNDGAGNFGPQHVITTAANGPVDVFAADLDGDGDMDVLSASSNDDKIACYFNNGAGNFGPQQTITTAADGAFSVYGSHRQRTVQALRGLAAVSADMGLSANWVCLVP